MKGIILTGGSGTRLVHKHKGRSSWITFPEIVPADKAGASD